MPCSWMLGVRTHWYLIMQQLHRFMIAVPWVAVNHSLPVSEGIEIRHRCQFISCLVRALSKLSGGMGVAKREPIPCYHDAYSVGTPWWAFRGNYGQKERKTTLSPLVRRVLLVNKRTNFFFC